MSDARYKTDALLGRRALQKGMSAVELALISVFFFTLVFGVLEFARLMYLFNTLQEVTRRAAVAAANTDFTDNSALDDVRRSAIFRTTPGVLPFSETVSDQAVRIDYMSIQRDASGTSSMTAIPPGFLPSGPADNRKTCLANPYASNCIRLVRVQVCDPGVTPACDRLPFISMIPFVALSIQLPRATTIVKAESLGLSP